MARQARIRSKTDVYHVVMRGNNKTSIFDNSEDKFFFMKSLMKIENEEDMDLIAWCLMDNHVHLVIHVPLEIFDLVFKRLNVSYAAYYHRQNKTVGHVFQGRPKSMPLETDESLVNNIRYVHNNPVKSKIVKRVDEYRWSSYQTYLSGETNRYMKDVKEIIGSSNDSFTRFHLTQVKATYLDIKEDQEEYNLERAQSIIQDKCKAYGFADDREIYRHREALKDMITTLVEESGLSGRRIAKMIGMNESRLRSMKKR